MEALNILTLDSKILVLIVSNLEVLVCLIFNIEYSIFKELDIYVLDFNNLKAFNISTAIYSYANIYFYKSVNVRPYKSANICFYKLVNVHSYKLVNICSYKLANVCLYNPVYIHSYKSMLNISMIGIIFIFTLLFIRLFASNILDFK